MTSLSKQFKLYVLLAFAMPSIFGSQAAGQTSVWTGGGGHYEWNENENWTGPWSGSTVDVVIGLAPQFQQPWTVSLNDSLIGNPDLSIELNSLTVGPLGKLQIADQLDFKGNAQTTILNQGHIQVRDQNGQHALYLVRDVMNSGLIEIQHNVFSANNWLIVDSGGATLKGGGDMKLGGNLGGQLTGPADALSNH